MFPASRLDVAENEPVTPRALIRWGASLAGGPSCSVDLPQHWLRAEWNINGFDFGTVNEHSTFLRGND